MPARRVCTEAMALNDVVTGESAPGDLQPLSFCAAAPIVSASGEVLGSVCLRDSKPIDLSGVRQSALAAVTRSIAVSVEASRKAETAKQHADRVDLQLRMSRAMHAVTDVAASAPDGMTALQVTLESLCANLGWPAACAWRVGERGWLTHPAVAFASASLSSAAAELLRTGERPPQILELMATAVAEKGTRCHGGIAAVPLFGENSLVILELWVSRDDRGAEALPVLLDSFAQQYAIVAARAEANARLRESEEECRDLFDKAQDCMCIHDIEGRLLKVNVAMARTLGYEDPSELVGRSVRSLLAPSDAERFDPYVARIISDAMAEGTMRVRTRAGAERVIQYRNTARLDRGKSVVLSIARDITDIIATRMRTPHTEREGSSSVLRAMLEVTSDALCAISRDGELLTWNAQFSNLLGCTDADLRTTPLAQLVERVLPWVVYPERARGILDANRWQHGRVATDRIELLDGRVLQRTEQPLWVEGEIAGRVVSFRNITALDARETEDREHRERLSSILHEWTTIFDAMPLPMLVVDENLVVHRRNRAADALLGDAAGATTLSLHQVAGTEPWTTVAAMCRSNRNVSLEVMSRTTEHVWDISVSGHDIQERGRRQSMVVIHDVTKSHDLQRSLRQFEAMSDLGTLVVAVAHEVRNPLAGIAASLDALEACLGTEPAQVKFITRLRRELGRLNRVMSDLLEYGRVRPLSLRELRIEDLIAASVSACQSLAESRGVELQIVPFHSTGTTYVDNDRIQQVLQNAIDNAIRYSPRGGCVRIGAREESRVTGVWTVVTVEDQGPGFDPASIDRVFEPFFTRRPDGTGLGLALVDKIVREHGGTVAARNAASGGALLEVALRAHRDPNG